MKLVSDDTIRITQVRIGPNHYTRQANTSGSIRWYIVTDNIGHGLVDSRYAETLEGMYQAEIEPYLEETEVSA